MRKSWLILALMALAAFLPHGSGTPNAPATLPQVNVFSTSGSTVAAPEVRFAHIFKKGDVPRGFVLTLTASAQNVPYTPARRNLWPDGSLRSVDLLMKLPVNVPSSGALTVQLGATAGSWSGQDALPGSVTITSVVSDIVTNHDDEWIVLSGVTNSSGTVSGSGTYHASIHSANSATGTHGGHRCEASGATAVDCVFYMHFTDETGGADHPSLLAWFYVTAWLNTSTGAVTFVESRPWVGQGLTQVSNDRFAYQAKVLLGNTEGTAATVRTFGFSTDETGSRAVTTAQTNVSTSTGQVTAANGFGQGDAVTVTSDGTLPAGLSGGTQYFVKFPTSTTFLLALTPDGSGTTIIPTTQGSGNITFHYTVQHLYAAKIALTRADGLWDRWTGLGNSGFAARPPIRFEHNQSYYRSTGLITPIDTSVGLTPSAESGPTNYSPATLGQMTWIISGAGANDHIGTITQWSARAFVQQSDWTGYVKTARVQALMQGTFPIHWVRDDTTFRIPTVNNGTANSGTAYAGMGALMPTAFYQDNSTFGGWATQAGGQSAIAQLDPTHWPHALVEVYEMEGGQDILDLLVEEANWWISTKPNGAANSSTTNRNQTLIGNSAVVYQSAFTPELRGDAWNLLNMLYGAMLATTDSSLPGNPTSEGSYLASNLNDTLAFMMDWINNGFLVAGFHPPSAQYTASGLWTGVQTGTAVDFEQSFFGMASTLADVGWGTADAVSLATFSAKNWKRLLIDAPGNYSAESRNIGYRLSGAGSTPITDTSIFSASSGYGVLVLTDVASNGTFTAEAGFFGSGSAFGYQPQNGDKIWFTDEQVGALENSGGPFPASGLNKTTIYFMCSVNLVASTFQVSTNSNCSSPLTSVSATVGINSFWNAFGSPFAPTTILPHNSASMINWNQGYFTMLRTIAIMMVRSGLLANQARVNAVNLYALESGQVDSPTTTVGFNKPMPNLNVTLN